MSPSKDIEKTVAIERHIRAMAITQVDEDTFHALADKVQPDLDQEPFGPKPENPVSCRVLRTLGRIIDREIPELEGILDPNDGLLRTRRRLDRCLCIGAKNCHPRALNRCTSFTSTYFRNDSEVPGQVKMFKTVADAMLRCAKNLGGEPPKEEPTGGPSIRLACVLRQDPPPKKKKKSS